MPPNVLEKKILSLTIALYFKKTNIGMITCKYDSLFSYWTFSLTLFNLLSFFSWPLLRKTMMLTYCLSGSQLFSSQENFLFILFKLTTLNHSGALVPVWKLLSNYYTFRERIKLYDMQGFKSWLYNSVAMQHCKN